MPTDDPISSEILERLLSSGPADGPCLDADAVAALAEGRLCGDRRTAAMRHVASCADCRSWVADTAESLDDGRVVVRRWRPAMAAAAAAALVAALGWWAVRASAPASPREMVVAAADRMRDGHADVFGEFRPLTNAELAEPGPDAERGGMTLVTPAMSFIEGRPVFAWQPVAAATGYAVSARDEDGAVLFELESSEPRLAYPQALPPIASGTRFVWKVTARGPMGEVRGSRAARRLGDEEAVRYRRGLELLRADAPGRDGAILAAHWAIRFGLLAEAREAIGEPLTGASELERSTADYVARRIGAK